MSMKKLSQRVLEKFKEYDIDVQDSFPNDKKEEKHVILAEGMIIEIDNNENIIDLSFHVGVLADRAASIILILKQISTARIDIAELFDFEKGKPDFIHGEAAIKNHLKGIEKEAIQKFIQDQTEMHFLATIDSPVC